MYLKWYGHSCFQFTTSGGVRIVTDPYDEKVGYPMHRLAPDIVTISHAHYDHDNLAMIEGKPIVLREAGVYAIKGVRITVINSYHDDKKGALRGDNLIFLFEADGLSIAHMGDLGEMPPDEALAILDPVDIILVPSGGVYTIGPRLACDVANAMHANVLIPMHYQTPVLRLPKKLHTVDELIALSSGCSIHRLNQSECTLTLDNLGKDRLLVLDYEK